MTGFVFRPLPVMTIASIGAFAVLIWLGQWQLSRYQEKTALIDTLETQRLADPVPFDEALADLSGPEDQAFRPVTVSGVFDHGAEAHVFGNVSSGGAGFFIVTPLIRQEGPPVLVNRGFVPAPLKAPEDRAEGQVTGPVTVTGFVRPPGVRNSFTPETDRARNIWYWRDLDGMAAAAGLRDAAPVFVDAVEPSVPGGWPRPGLTRPKVTNKHLGYAATWFGLAAGLVVIYGGFHAAQGRLRFGKGRAA